jgi:acetyltransferase-like isoleucine patch superfamily enzyme
MLLRWLLLRVSGLQLRTINIREDCKIHNSHLSVGSNSTIGRGCFFEGSGQIKIGDFTQVGPDCTFITSNHEIWLDSGQLQRSRGVSEDIVVGSRVWLGTRVTVLPGSEIPNDTVVAAGAVVRGSLKSGHVYGGIPARPIRELSSEVPATKDNVGGRP